MMESKFLRNAPSFLVLEFYTKKLRCRFECTLKSIVIPSNPHLDESLIDISRYLEKIQTLLKIANPDLHLNQIYQLHLDFYPDYTLF